MACSDGEHLRENMLPSLSFDPEHKLLVFVLTNFRNASSSYIKVIKRSSQHMDADKLYVVI